MNKYPRVQLKRNSYYSLNGEWTLNGKTIQVPYPPNSKLSYFQGNDKVLKYEKSFTLNNIDNDMVILHFEAVDQKAKVYLNNHLLGEHVGGYLPFSFCIKEYLQENNKLVVEVEDSLSHDYPYGKQSHKSKGMWYSEVSGIWQSVWIEAVPYDYIEDIKITPTLSSVRLQTKTSAQKYKVIINDKEIGIYDDKDIVIDIENPHLWSPDDPYLYSLVMETKHDHIESYFALRTITIQDNKLYLNNRRIFLNGVLDQGYFHDGLFIPKDEEEYKRDILRMKELGFNTIRKHIKIENQWFYYYCDKLGMLVIQDHVNNGNYSWLFDTALPNIGLQRRKDTLRVNEYQKEIFKQHMLCTLEHLYNHPCIIIYTIFNEGWGQVDSDEMYSLCKNYDSTRLYDSTSGWFKQKLSDFDSRHVYFKNKQLSSSKIMLLSECGGYVRVVQDHSYASKTYGYGTCNSEEELTDSIIKLYEEMVLPSIKNDLCGCIYTQLSDVENELNGLYTYDREVCKVNKDKLYKLSLKIKKEIEG